MPRKTVRIRDVATAAGVSPATVSQALNGKGRLPAETRLHVQRIARELGYRPNASARSLSLGRTGVLGLAATVPGSLRTAFVDIDYFSRAIHTATAAATENGFALVVVPGTATPEVWDRLPLDGAVVAEPRLGDRHASELRARGVPVVTIGRELDHAGGYWVDNDIPAVTRRMLDHLAASGARRVALVAWEWGNAGWADSVEAYRAWCAEQGHEQLIETLAPQAPADPLHRLLALTDPPDAVYVLYEQLALEVLTSASAHGLRVPDDVLVAAASDSSLAELADPPLTTVEFTPDLLGRAAVELLIELVEGRTPPERTVVLPASIAERASTAGGLRGVRSRPR